MNDNFNEQKDTLIAIKKEINLLRQQVDYLIRNEQPLGLLDLDVLMNRTHRLYDLMCGMEVENEELGTESEDEELPVEPEVIRSVFGIEEETPQEETVFEQEEPVGEKEEMSASEPEETPQETTLPQEEPIEPANEEEEETLPEEEPVAIEEETIEENEDAYFEEEVEDETTPEEVPEESAKGDDLGFILNFEHKSFS